MKKYEVIFKETYEYTRTIELKDDEDIEEVIHDPLQCPTVRDMDAKQFESLSPCVCNDYEIIEKKGDE